MHACVHTWCVEHSQAFPEEAMLPRAAPAQPLVSALGSTLRAAAAVLPGAFGPVCFEALPAERCLHGRPCVVQSAVTHESP